MAQKRTLPRIHDAGPSLPRVEPDVVARALGVDGVVVTAHPPSNRASHTRLCEERARLLHANIAKGKEDSRRPDDLDRLIEKQRCKFPDFDERLEETHADFDVAQKIYNLRASAGLTQAKLAKLIGTKASVIERLENADYDGHALAMLRRVAAALDLRVELRCVLIRRRRKVT